jgi:hypothetical protein
MNCAWIIGKWGNDKTSACKCGLNNKKTCLNLQMVEIFTHHNNGLSILVIRLNAWMKSQNGFDALDVMAFIHPHSKQSQVFNINRPSELPTPQNKRFQRFGCLIFVF